MALVVDHELQLALEHVAALLAFMPQVPPLWPPGSMMKTNPSRRRPRT